MPLVDDRNVDQYTSYVPDFLHVRLTSSVYDDDFALDVLCAV